MKKKTVIILLAIALLSIVFLGSIILAGGHGYDKDEFLSIETEYTRVAQLYYNDYQTLNVTTIVDYSFPASDRIIKRLSPYDTEIEITKEQYASFKTVYDNYDLDDHQLLETIRVCDGFVAFCNINGRESFIYSVNDKKPKFVNKPSDRFDYIYVSKITDNWYYAYGVDFSF